MKAVTKSAWPLGPPLRARREAAGLSQTVAARRAGISTSKWRQLETGTTKTRSGLQEMGTTAVTVAKAARAVTWDIAEALAVAGYDPREHKALIEELREPEPQVSSADVVPGFSMLSRATQEALLALVATLSSETASAAERSPAMALGYGPLPDDAVQRGRPVAYSDHTSSAQTGDS